MEQHGILCVLTGQDASMQGNVRETDPGVEQCGCQRGRILRVVEPLAGSSPAW